MRKLRLREGDMEKYRLEMELQLGDEHRTVRDEWQSERGKMGLEWGQKHVHSLGWELTESGHRMDR